jgi:uncharacterized membrane protein YkoI
MRFLRRALIVVIATALFLAAGRNPDNATNSRSETARAATVVRVQQPAHSEQGDAEQGASERDSADQPASGAAADRAKQAAEAAVRGATAREVEREANDDNPSSAYEVELTRPDGSTVEVDLSTHHPARATGVAAQGDLAMSRTHQALAVPALSLGRYLDHRGRRGRRSRALQARRATGSGSPAARGRP